MICSIMIVPITNFYHPLTSAEGSTRERCLHSYNFMITVDCIIEVREGNNQNWMRGRNLFADLTSTYVREHGP